MRRLDEELPAGFEVALLRAGQGGTPPEDRRARALDAALGALSAGTAAPIVAKVTAAASARHVVKSGLLAGWKAFLAGALSAAAVAGAASIAQAPAPPPRPVAPDSRAEPSIPRPTAPETRGAAPRAWTRPPSPSSATPPTVSARAAVVSTPYARKTPEARVMEAPPVLTAAPAAATPPADALSAGLAAIDAAQTALADHRPDDAIAALDAYARQYPGATLAREAEILRIEALVQRGDRAEALRRARVMRGAADFDGLYERKLQQILGP